MAVLTSMYVRMYVLLTLPSAFLSENFT